jgi:hypothetical protein
MSDLAELRKLSTAVIVRLHKARHEILDHALKNELEEVLWERLVVDVVEWPSPWDNKKSPWRCLDSDHVVYCCPDSADHPPRRHLLVYDLSIRLWECSCGKKIHERELKMRQRYGSALVWPILDMRPVPCFVVCSQAPAADDPDHAPMPSGTRCICRYTLDPLQMPDGVFLKYMPVQ